MAGNPERGQRSWPAWLDEDDFDGLGEEAWRAAMESLAEDGPEPDGQSAGLPDADVCSGDPAAAAPGGGREGGDRPVGVGLPEDSDVPVLGFGPGDAGELMPPGVSLGMLAEHAVTSGTLPGMSDYEVVSLVGAARRLRNRAQWLELQAVREFTRRRWESDPFPVRDENGRWQLPNTAAEHAADELAFHLTDSRAHAEDRMDLSLALRDRLPRLDALLAAGLLDDWRVAGVRDVTIGLSDEQARLVDEMLAPDASDLPYAALRRRAAKLAISLSPETEARRKNQATRRKARVEKFLERSGNYALAVREMPVEEILASEAHIRALAGYLRSNGVQLGQREAEVMVYLDLTQGRDPLDRIPPGHRDPAGPGDSPRPARDSEGDGNDGSSHDSDGPDHADAGGGPGEPESGLRGWRDDEGPQDDEGRRDGPWDDYDDDEDGDSGDGNDGDGGGGGGGGPWPFAPPGPGRPGGRAPFPATINLLVPVGTAFGWSAMPGEAGRDVIDPQTLREMMQAASRHPATRWCVTLIDDKDKTAVAHGCARGRHQWDPPPDANGAAAPGPAPAQLGQLAAFLARLKITFEPIAKGSCDHRHAEPRYRPSRALRHLILARNATCPAPGCQASSHHSDLDHTQAWPEGATDECNIGPPCRHHHRSKQAPGWRLEQPAPGVFRWTTPSGHTYQARPTTYDT